MFHGVPQSDIILLQAYTNPDRIRDLLHKPNISDNTARAYSRLANQYVKYLDAPTPTVIRYVLKKYKRRLVIGDFVTNLLLMGNVEPIKYPPIVIENIEELIFYIYGIYPEKKKYGYVVVINIWDWELQQSIIETQLVSTKVFSTQFRKFGVGTMRIYMGLKTDKKTDKNLIWVSTGRFMVKDGMQIDLLQEFTEQMLISPSYFSSSDEFVHIEQVIQLRITFFMDV